MSLLTLRSTTACLDENVALELLDGTLSTGARTNVEKHLEECDPCRELVAELAQIAQANSQEPFEVTKPIVGSGVERPADTERTPFARTTSSSSSSSSGKGSPGSGGDSLILTEGMRAGPYRIEHPIGSGAAGTVYRAVDERNGRVVALKHVTDTMMRTRFLREAETLRRLDHPGIVRYIDHGETQGAGMYLAMEWLEGEDLDQHARRRVGTKKMPWREARVLGDRVASALAHAHMFGAVHRDLSPKNVFLVDRRVDQAKLLDFGLVRLPDANAGPERTASQAVLGTPFYMSPEQVRDPKSVDARSDLFSLGVLLFELLSGKRPFEGDDLFTVWVRIVDQPTPDLRALVPEVPEPFIRLVEALLAKEANARPPSASDVQRVLQKIDTMIGPGGTATLPPIRPTPSSGAATYPPPSPPPVQPPPTPQMSPAPPPTKRSSGVFVAASVGVGVTAIVGATTLGVLYKGSATSKGDDTAQVDAGPRSAKENTSAKTPTAGGTTATTSTATVAAAKVPADADDDDESQPVAQQKSTGRISTSSPAKGEDPNAEVQSQPNLSCGSDDVVVRRNMRFRPDPNMPPGIGDSVFVGGDCKLTLEDCVIEGPRALKIMGDATVTLRRCKVLGKVELIGPTPTLHLFETTLPQAPTLVGPGAKVVKH